jgi:hypothetical protein
MPYPISSPPLGEISEALPSVTSKGGRSVLPIRELHPKKTDGASVGENSDAAAEADFIERRADKFLGNYKN